MRSLTKKQAKTRFSDLTKPIRMVEKKVSLNVGYGPDYRLESIEFTLNQVAL